MHVTTVTDPRDPRLAPFFALRDRNLRAAPTPLFIAESPKVIIRALDAGYVPLSLLCEDRHLSGDAAPILERFPDLEVFTGARDMLASLTGYELTRGVLCAFARPAMPEVADICRDARRLCVIDGVCDATNVGAIFRSAAALGIDGIICSGGSCDPLNRRALRVAMGTTFAILWTECASPWAELRANGFKTVALALRDNAIELTNGLLHDEPRLALILGTEGDGLSDTVIADADFCVRIPMRRGVDSLNVAAASAVAFWALR